jgi:hypothetical protein
MVASMAWVLGHLVICKSPAPEICFYFNSMKQKVNLAAREFETIHLVDTRRDKRLMNMMEDFSAMPTIRITQASGDWTDIL